MPIRGLGFIGRQYCHVNRYRQIASVLLKHSFGDFYCRNPVQAESSLSGAASDGMR